MIWKQDPVTHDYRGSDDYRYVTNQESAGVAAALRQCDLSGDFDDVTDRDCNGYVLCIMRRVAGGDASMQIRARQIIFTHLASEP